MDTSAPVVTRPRGTAALIAGIAALVTGLLMWPLGFGLTGIGAGGVVGVVGGVLTIAVGVALRLAGGPERPPQARRAVLLGAGIPLGVGVFFQVILAAT